MTVGAIKRVLTLWICTVLLGCAGYGDNGREQVIPSSVAILGVVQQDGLNIPINEFRLSLSLEDILRDEHRYPVMDQQQVRLALGDETHDILLRRMAKSGELTAQDLRMLRSSTLRTPMALILTITGNEVSSLPAKRKKLRDSQGNLLSSREHRVLSTQRKVSMTATLVELNVGRVRMHENFSLDSIAQKRYLVYSGSSLTGSVAASLVNAVSNGAGNLKYPPAPNLHESFLNLLDDLAKELPIH